MKRLTRRLFVFFVLVGLILCGIALEERDSELGLVLTVSVVEAPPGDGGCPTCGQILPYITREG
jgi:hypothetical protein